MPLRVSQPRGRVTNKLDSDLLGVAEMLKLTLKGKIRGPTAVTTMSNQSNSDAAPRGATPPRSYVSAKVGPDKHSNKSERDLLGYCSYLAVANKSWAIPNGYCRLETYILFLYFTSQNGICMSELFYLALQ